MTICVDDCNLIVLNHKQYKTNKIITKFKNIKSFNN